MMSRILARALWSGIPTASRRGRRRRAASSRSKGRLVAARTTTRAAADALRRPSQAERNSLRSRRVASCSWPSPRRPRRASTSSRKITHGAMRRATRKSAATAFSSSPYHLEVISDKVTLRKRAPASVATAFASSVLPVPGGPERSTPWQAWRAAPREKSAGCCSGRLTTSRSVRFTASRAPTSSKRTPTAPGATTSRRMASSCAS
mmetsp:Transcript_18488/g.61937  ORF Transcript_18488/g.61937 Transcript_18488/m.61937 type:complete len:206 (+) Transcript_18488:586-1203(+)